MMAVRFWFGRIDGWRFLAGASRLLHYSYRAHHDMQGHPLKPQNMKPTILPGILFVALSLHGQGPASPRPLAERSKEPGTSSRELQGSWVVAKATMNGKETRDRALLEGNWKFQGNELILESRQKGTVRFTIQIDEKAKPKAFHITSVEPSNSGSGWMLFSREANTLKIAFYDNLEGRPEGFEPMTPRSEPELVVVTLSPKK